MIVAISRQLEPECRKSLAWAARDSKKVTRENLSLCVRSYEVRRMGAVGSVAKGWFGCRIQASRQASLKGAKWVGIVSHAKAVDRQ